jgi:hypothetical protein
MKGLRGRCWHFGQRVEILCSVPDQDGRNGSCSESAGKQCYPRRAPTRLFTDLELGP